MSIMLTEKAASEVKKIITEQKLAPETVLRVGVAGGGCSGFSYSLGFDTAFDPKADSKTEQHGIAVVVDKKSDLFLDGTTLDFHDAIDKRGFGADDHEMDSAALAKGYDRAVIEQVQDEAAARRSGIGARAHGV
jgi:iron-sulfur cluster assembly protein